eukprot:TRINITY_DN17517_c0_g1_i1.p1 TRINITY_DN17517_c0_g1~~TRINITY_DN17517_c0_g1_i1.p1  ORF type:complete len:3962 (+),score=929.55 TRINITY_DN17517_c0_g1_i1:272-12157(+)
MVLGDTVSIAKEILCLPKGPVRFTCVDRSLWHLAHLRYGLCLPGPGCDPVEEDGIRILYAEVPGRGSEAHARSQRRLPTEPDASPEAEQPPAYPVFRGPIREAEPDAVAADAVEEDAASETQRSEAADSSLPDVNTEFFERYAEMQISLRTCVRFLSECYHFVMALDLSPSLFVVDASFEGYEQGNYLVESLLPSLKETLLTLLAEIRIGRAGDEVRIEPQIFITVVAHDGREPTMHHLTRSLRVTRDNLDQVCADVRNRWCQHLGNLFEEPNPSSPKSDTAGTNKPRRDGNEVYDLVFTLKSCLMTLSLSAVPDATSAIVLFTDGVLNTNFRELGYSGILTQLNALDVPLHIVQMGGGFAPWSALGMCSDIELLKFIVSSSPNGTLFQDHEINALTLCLDDEVSSNSELVMNTLQKGWLSRKSALSLPDRPQADDATGEQEGGERGAQVAPRRSEQGSMLYQEKFSSNAPLALLVASAVRQGFKLESCEPGTLDREHLRFNFGLTCLPMFRVLYALDLLTLQGMKITISVQFPSETFPSQDKSGASVVSPIRQRIEDFVRSCARKLHEENHDLVDMVEACAAIGLLKLKDSSSVQASPNAVQRCFSTRRFEYLSPSGAGAFNDLKERLQAWSSIKPMQTNQGVQYWRMFLANVDQDSASTGNKFVLPPSFWCSCCAPAGVHMLNLPNTAWLGCSGLEPGLRLASEAEASRDMPLQLLRRTMPPCCFVEVETVSKHVSTVTIGTLGLCPHAERVLVAALQSQIFCVPAQRTMGFPALDGKQSKGDQREKQPGLTWARGMSVGLPNRPAVLKGLSDNKIVDAEGKKAIKKEVKRARPPQLLNPMRAPATSQAKATEAEEGTKLPMGGLGGSEDWPHTFVAEWSHLKECLPRWTHQGGSFQTREAAEHAFHMFHNVRQKEGWYTICGSDKLVCLMKRVPILETPAPVVQKVQKVQKKQGVGSGCLTPSTEAEVDEDADWPLEDDDGDLEFSVPAMGEGDRAEEPVQGPTALPPPCERQALAAFDERRSCTLYLRLQLESKKKDQEEVRGRHPKDYQLSTTLLLDSSPGIFHTAILHRPPQVTWRRWNRTITRTPLKIAPYSNLRPGWDPCYVASVRIDVVPVHPQVASPLRVNLLDSDDQLVAQLRTGGYGGREHVRFKTGPVEVAAVELCAEGGGAAILESLWYEVAEKQDSMVQKVEPVEVSVLAGRVAQELRDRDDLINRMVMFFEDIISSGSQGESTAPEVSPENLEQDLQSLYQGVQRKCTVPLDFAGLSSTQHASFLDRVKAVAAKTYQSNGSYICITPHYASAAHGSAYKAAGSRTYSMIRIPTPTQEAGADDANMLSEQQALKLVIFDCDVDKFTPKASENPLLCSILSSNGSPEKPPSAATGEEMADVSTSELSRQANEFLRKVLEAHWQAACEAVYVRSCLFSKQLVPKLPDSAVVKAALERCQSCSRILLLDDVRTAAEAADHKVVAYLGAWLDDCMQMSLQRQGFSGQLDGALSLEDNSLSFLCCNLSNLNWDEILESQRVPTEREALCFLEVKLITKARPETESASGGADATPPAGEVTEASFIGGAEAPPAATAAATPGLGEAALTRPNVESIIVTAYYVPDRVANAQRQPADGGYALPAKGWRGLQAFKADRPILASSVCRFTEDLAAAVDIAHVDLLRYERPPNAGTVQSIQGLFSRLRSPKRQDDNVTFAHFAHSMTLPIAIPKSDKKWSTKAHEILTIELPQATMADGRRALPNLCNVPGEKSESTVFVWLDYNSLCQKETPEESEATQAAEAVLPPPHWVLLVLPQRLEGGKFNLEVQIVFTPTFQQMLKSDETMSPAPYFDICKRAVDRVFIVMNQKLLLHQAEQEGHLAELLYEKRPVSQANFDDNCTPEEFLRQCKYGDEAAASSSKEEGKSTNRTGATASFTPGSVQEEVPDGMTPKGELGSPTGFGTPASTTPAPTQARRAPMMSRKGWALEDDEQVMPVAYDWSWQDQFEQYLPSKTALCCPYQETVQVSLPPCLNKLLIISWLSGGPTEEKPMKNMIAAKTAMVEPMRSEVKTMFAGCRRITRSGENWLLWPAKSADGQNSYYLVRPQYVFKLGAPVHLELSFYGLDPLPGGTHTMVRSSLTEKLDKLAIAKPVQGHVADNKHKGKIPRLKGELLDFLRPPNEPPQRSTLLAIPPLACCPDLHTYAHFLRRALVGIVDPVALDPAPEAYPGGSYLSTSTQRATVGEEGETSPCSSGAGRAGGEGTAQNLPPLDEHSERQPTMEHTTSMLSASATSQQAPPQEDFACDGSMCFLYRKRPTHQQGALDFRNRISRAHQRSHIQEKVVQFQERIGDGVAFIEVLFVSASTGHVVNPLKDEHIDLSDLLEKDPLALHREVEQSHIIREGASFKKLNEDIVGSPQSGKEDVRAYLVLNLWKRAMTDAQMQALDEELRLTLDQALRECRLQCQLKDARRSPTQELRNQALFAQADLMETMLDRHLSSPKTQRPKNVKSCPSIASANRDELETGGEAATTQPFCLPPWAVLSAAECLHELFQEMSKEAAKKNRPAQDGGAGNTELDCMVFLHAQRWNRTSSKMEPAEKGEKGMEFEFNNNIFKNIQLLAVLSKGKASSEPDEALTPKTILQDLDHSAALLPRFTLFWGAGLAQSGQATARDSDEDEVHSFAKDVARGVGISQQRMDHLSVLKEGVTVASAHAQTAWKESERHLEDNKLAEPFVCVTLDGTAARISAVNTDAIVPLKISYLLRRQLLWAWARVQLARCMCALEVQGQSGGDEEDASESDSGPISAGLVPAVLQKNFAWIFDNNKQCKEMTNASPDDDRSDFDGSVRSEFASAEVDSEQPFLIFGLPAKVAEVVMKCDTVAPSGMALDGTQEEGKKEKVPSSNVSVATSGAVRSMTAYTSDSRNAASMAAAAAAKSRSRPATAKQVVEFTEAALRTLDSGDDCMAEPPVPDVSSILRGAPLMTNAIENSKAPRDAEKIPLALDDVAQDADEAPAAEGQPLDATTEAPRGDAEKSAPDDVVQAPAAEVQPLEASNEGQEQSLSLRNRLTATDLFHLLGDSWFDAAKEAMEKHRLKTTMQQMIEDWERAEAPIFAWAREAFEHVQALPDAEKQWDMEKSEIERRNPELHVLEDPMGFQAEAMLLAFIRRHMVEPIADAKSIRLFLLQEVGETRKVADPRVGLRPGQQSQTVATPQGILPEKKGTAATAWVWAASEPQYARQVRRLTVHPHLLNNLVAAFTRPVSALGPTEDISLKSGALTVGWRFVACLRNPLPWHELSAELNAENHSRFPQSLLLHRAACENVNQELMLEVRCHQQGNSVDLEVVGRKGSRGSEGVANLAKDIYALIEDFCTDLQLRLMVDALRPCSLGSPWTVVQMLMEYDRTKSDQQLPTERDGRFRNVLVRGNVNARQVSNWCKERTNEEGVHLGLKTGDLARCMFRRATDCGFQEPAGLADKPYLSMYSSDHRFIRLFNEHAMAADFHPGGTQSGGVASAQGPIVEQGIRFALFAVPTGMDQSMGRTDSQIEAPRRGSIAAGRQQQKTQGELGFEFLVVVADFAWLTPLCASREKSESDHKAAEDDSSPPAHQRSQKVQDVAERRRQLSEVIARAAEEVLVAFAEYCATYLSAMRRFNSMFNNARQTRLPDMEELLKACSVHIDLKRDPFTASAISHLFGNLPEAKYPELGTHLKSVFPGQWCDIANVALRTNPQDVATSKALPPMEQHLLIIFPVGEPANLLIENERHYVLLHLVWCTKENGHDFKALWLHSSHSLSPLGTGFETERRAAAGSAPGNDAGSRQGHNKPPPESRMKVTEDEWGDEEDDKGMPQLNSAMELGRHPWEQSMNSIVSMPTGAASSGDMVGHLSSGGHQQKRAHSWNTTMMDRIASMPQQNADVLRRCSRLSGPHQMLPGVSWLTNTVAPTSPLSTVELLVQRFVTTLLVFEEEKVRQRRANWFATS